MTATAEGRRLVAAVERSEERTTTVDAFLGELSAQVGKVVPFDGAMWFGVDPSTLLALTPSRVTNMDPALCWTFWHGEFNTSDALQFRDLARQERPVGALRLATGGTPVRSARYRDFLQPQGYADEARVAFRTGSTTWAVAALYRDQGREPFSSDDLEVLLAASPAVGAALRRFSIRTTAPSGCLTTPGVMLFSGKGLLLSANREAKDWLAHLYGPRSDDCSWEALLAMCGTSDGLMHATPIQPLVSRARAVARGHDEGPVRVRLRDRGGRWVVLHASCLDERDGDGPVVVVAEPAKSAEIAPIIVEAYGLTPREREVVRGIATGLSTPEIAAELFLSAHTVRDYIKSVFEKVGVGSRGELVAKLFAEHYADTLHAGMVHADA